MKGFFYITASIALAACLLSCANQEPAMIPIQGGSFSNSNSNYYEIEFEIADFYIGRFEVTQKEWTEIMGFNPSVEQGENLPVDSVSWYESILYCNRRSLAEGLEPYYIINKNTPDPGNLNPDDPYRWKIIRIPEANGYRLPTEAEWEYAASGGSKSRNHIYSGGTDIDKLGWYWRNSGDNYLTGEWRWQKVEHNNNRSRPVGSLQPNELGLFDMSGNLREWCWDWFGPIDPAMPHGIGSGSSRVWKGGGIIGGERACEIAFRGSFEPSSSSRDQGFRVARSR